MKLSKCAFFFAIKITEFKGIVPLWGLLERLEGASACKTTPPSIQIPLRNSVGAVASMHNLRTPLAKARGWIRQVLNAKQLDTCLQAILFNSSVDSNKLLNYFYYNHAIFHNTEDANIMVSFF